MADALRPLLSFPPPASRRPLDPAGYDGLIKAYVKKLGTVLPDVILQHGNGQPDLLEIVDPSIHSILYMQILWFRILHTAGECPRAIKAVPENLRPSGIDWRRLETFMKTFDPVQVRYDGETWRKMVEYIYHASRAADSPSVGIEPIREAMLRLDPSTGTFTSTHLLFLRLCMQARDYRAAYPILKNRIYAFSGGKTIDRDTPLLCAQHSFSSSYITKSSRLSDELNVSDIQEYFLLGAMAYLGLAMHKEALLFLEHVLTVPTQSVANGLMLEAYRKWLLVGCLLNGKTPILPRTINGHALKSVRSASRAYEALADDFTLRNSAKLQADIEAGEMMWEQDGNLGLIEELVRYLPRFVIANLSKTYAAIPLSKVCEWLGESEEQMEPYVRELISSGNLNAQVERRDTDARGAQSILRFYPDLSSGPLAKSEQVIHTSLVDQTARIKVLTEQVRVAEHRLALTNEYVEHLRKQGLKELSAGAAEGGMSNDRMDTSYDGFDDNQDEDMMADLH